MKRMIVCGCVFVLLLSGCSGSGLDRKMNSGKQVDQTYLLALSEATPAQQNVLRERMTEVMQYLTFKTMLVMLANPASTVEASEAKKNLDELERIEQMTVGQFLIDWLSSGQAERVQIISMLESVHKGNIVKLQTMRIDTIRPTDSTQTPEIEVSGTLVLRNDAKNFDFALPECEIPLRINEQFVKAKLKEQNCIGMVVIERKGGQKEFPFSFVTRDPKIVALLTNPDSQEALKAVAVTFLVPNSAVIRMDGEQYRAGKEDWEERVATHAKRQSDIEILKRK